MNRVISAVSILLLLFINCVFSADSDYIIAIVNDDIIIQSELDANLAFIYMQLSKHFEGEELAQEFSKFKDDILLKMIEDKLILQEAQSQGYQANEERVKARIDDLKAQFYSQDEFNRFLSESGLSLGDIKDKFRNEILMKAMIEKEVESKIVVHPKEITDYYNSNKYEFHRQKGVNVDLIFVPIEKKEELLADLEEYTDFEKLKKKYIGSTQTIDVYLGEFRKEVEDKIFSLEIGQYSQPVEIGSSVYVFRLADKIGGYTREIEDVQDYIYEKLMNKRITEGLAKWINQLKEKAYIIIK